MENYKYYIKPTHISGIRIGDTILCEDGHMRTVGKNNIKKGGFCGTTLFGDCYLAGNKLVEKVIFIKAV